MARALIIDAFTHERFAGNSAGVVLLDKPAPEAWMQGLAKELGFSETAYTWPEANGARRLRWFTPAREVALCGHATIATAHALWSSGATRDPLLRFQTLSGELTARKDRDLIELDFPTAQIQPAEPPAGLDKALGARIVRAASSSGKWFLVELENERAVRDLQPDINWLATLDPHTIIVTARGEKVDFVHRYFAPSWGVPEDPATGSIQTVLGPYWQKALGKDTLEARQLSARGAGMRVRVAGDRTLIAGGAVTVMQGEVEAPA